MPPHARLWPVFERTPPAALPPAHRMVLVLLTAEPLPCDRLARRAGLGRNRVFIVLRELEAAGWITRQPTTREDGGRGVTAYEIHPERGQAIVRVRRGAWRADRRSPNDRADA